MSIFTGAVTLLLLAGGALTGERRPVPLYTNDDLARIAASRGDTEVTPAPTAPPPRPARAEAPDETKTEGYWRARARRLEEKLEPLRDQLAELQLQLADTRRAEHARSASPSSPSSRSPRARPAGEGGGEARLLARIARLEARIREAGLRLEDDARRAGALPGWLR